MEVCSRLGRIFTLSISDLHNAPTTEKIPNPIANSRTWQHMILSGKYVISDSQGLSTFKPTPKKHHSNFPERSHTNQSNHRPHQPHTEPRRAPIIISHQTLRIENIVSNQVPDLIWKSRNSLSLVPFVVAREEWQRYSIFKILKESDSSGSGAILHLRQTVSFAVTNYNHFWQGEYMKDLKMELRLRKLSVKIFVRDCLVAGMIGSLMSMKQLIMIL